MTARILDGRAIAAQVRRELAGRVAALAGRGVVPGLAFVLVGDDPASASYVRAKNRASAELGIRTRTFHLPAEVPEAELRRLLAELNHDPAYHGVIVQLPFPPHIGERHTMEMIAPEKDVDGLHPLNMGRLLRGEPGFRPATPLGVQELLVRSGYDPSGKHVVVCGRSNLVGKPLAAMLMQKAPGANATVTVATVTVCHTGTPDLAAFTRQADILVAALGRPGTITAEMVRPGAVVIDVGINRVEDPSRKSGYRLVGDVDFPAVAARAGAITPVPGGVGPMTVAMLLANTVRAAEASAGAETSAGPAR